MTASTQGPSGCGKLNQRRNRKIGGEGGETGKGPQQACTTMFFLITKNVKQKYRVEWDATDGRNEGAQHTVCEVLMEMERFNGKAKAEDQGALALVPNLAKAFDGSVSLWSGPGRRTSASQERSCGCFVGISSTRVQFEGCATEPLTTITAKKPGSKSSCLLLRIVLQGAL